MATPTASVFRFPKDIAKIILGYALEWTMIPAIASKIPKNDDPKRPWCHWRRLSLNPRGVDHLDRHPELIDWRLIASNPAASHLIFSEQTKKRFSSGFGRRNCSGAGRGNRPVWLNGQRYYVNIAMLCRNSSETAIEILKTLSPECLVWGELSRNTHPWAIATLLTYSWKIRSDLFQANPSAAPHLERLGWLCPFNTMVSSNPNKELSAYLRANPAMIHPKGMLRNPELVSIFLDGYHSMQEYSVHRPNWNREMGTVHDIARNPNPRAISYNVTGEYGGTSRHGNPYIHWDDLIANPGIFELTEPIGLRDLLM
jgi:hypothetical protein